MASCEQRTTADDEAVGPNEDVMHDRHGAGRSGENCEGINEPFPRWRPGGMSRFEPRVMGGVVVVLPGYEEAVGT
jgi:hypothetical protein